MIEEHILKDGEIVLSRTTIEHEGLYSLLINLHGPTSRVVD